VTFKPSHTAWNGDQLDYDALILNPNDPRECSYCLTQSQAKALIALIDRYRFATRWFCETVVIDPLDLEYFVNDCQRRLMMSCCGDEAPLVFRWTIDGVLEMSSDGGVTFDPAPQFDPRNNSTQSPPIEGEDGEDKKCTAAAGMVALIKEQVGDQLTDDMSRYTLEQLIKDFTGTEINSGANIFQTLITIATNQIFALIISVLRAALTETVYDTLLCIFYCAMNDDASFTRSGLAEVREQIGDQIGGVATLFLQQLVFLLGVVGMTNLARSGGATEGDCSACTDCPSGCDPSGWTSELYYSGSSHAGRGGTIVETGADYVIIESQDRGDGQQEINFRVGDLVTCCTFTWEEVGAVSPHKLSWNTPCETSAELENWVRNDLIPTENTLTSLYFQLDPGTWQMKFTFV